MKFFNLYVVIFVGVAFVFASGAQGEKTTLFEEKVRARPEASPVQLESNAPKPAVKIKPRIDRKLEKEFSINLQNGIDAFQEEDFEASLTLLEKALHMIGSLPHRSGNAKNINKLLAQTARKLEDYEKLIRFQTRVVKLVLAEGDNGDSDELALERFNLGRYHASAKDNAAAAEYLIKALAHYKEYEYDDKSAATYRELGEVYETDSEYDLALWAYQKLLKLYRKTSDKKNSGATLKKMGEILFDRLNKYSEAEKYFTKANAIFLELGNAEMTAETFMDLGLVAEKNANTDKAKKLYDKARSLAEEKKLALTLSKAYLRQADLQWLRGNRKESFRSLKKSLEFAETKGGERQRLFVFNKIGLFYKDLGDAATALSYLDRSLNLAREIKSPIDEGSTLNNIGLVYRQDKNYAKAIEYFKKALVIYSDEKSQRGQAFSRLNLAICYRLTEKLRESDTHISEAIELSRETEDKTNLVKSLREKLALVVLQNKTVEMKSLYRELEALVKNSFGEGHPDMANLYNYQALLNAENGRYLTALDYFQKEFAIHENLIRDAFVIANEKQKLDFIQSAANSFKISLSLIHQNFAANSKIVTAGLEMTLRHKGAVFDAQSRAKESLRRQMDPQAQVDWDLANSLQAQLSHLTLNKPFQTPEENYLKIVASLKDQIRKAENRLAKASRLANIAFKQRKATAKAVAEKLPVNGALVEYVKINDYDFDNSRLGEKRYIAFVLKQSGEVKMLDLGLADSIDRQVILTLGHIKGSRADALQAGAATASSIGQSFASLRNLYQKLWAPLEGALAGVNTVFISPDGLVNHVPFAALPDMGGQWLVERFTLAYLTSGRELIGAGETAFKSESELLLLANPAYDKEATASLSDEVAVRSRTFSGQFEPLPESQIEARIISQLFKGPPEKKIVLMGAEATESMVKNARSPKIMHLATRGFFLAEEEEAPTLLRRYENPLLRSGLVFAGANHADEVTYGDDGVLTALEISGLALHGTYLVALTACETDIGEARTEEGVYALRRSFALAGAKNLLVNLWPAGDKSAIDQMTTFYKHLENMPPVKALRRAQLDAIGKLKKIYNGAAPPVLWAQFMLQGAGALQN